MAEPKELPQYKCHKLVRAARIVGIEVLQEAAQLQLDLISVEGLWPATIVVDRAYIDKHQPQVNGYYVLYDDGYESWSPAMKFEEGYTRAHGAAS